MRIGILFTLILFFQSNVFSQSNWMWGKESITNRAIVSSLGVDNNGDLVSIGAYDNYFEFQGFSVSNNANNGGIYILKTDALGNPIWLFDSESHHYSFGVDLDFDSQNNIFIGGMYVDTLIYDSLIITSADNSWNYEPFIFKLDESGNLVWFKIAVGIGNNDYVSSLTVDDNGDVIVAYNFSSPILEIDTISIPVQGLVSSVLVKYDNSGNVIWVKNPVFSSNHFVIRDVSTDPDNNIYITGWWPGDSLSFDSISTYSTNMISGSMFIAKFDSAGNTIFLNSFFGGVNDGIYGTEIEVDSDHNIYVTGSFFYNAYFDSIHLFAPDASAFFLKLDSIGETIWAYNPGGMNYTIGYEIGIDETKSNDMIYFFGGVQDPQHDNLILETDTYLANMNTTDPPFILLYDEFGTFICSDILPSGGNNNSLTSNNRFALDKNGGKVYLFLNGTGGTPIELWNDTLTSLGTNNFPYLVAFSCDFISGIQEELEGNVKLFPNPASSYFNYEIRNESFQNGELNIVDLNGKLIKKTQVAQNDDNMLIDVSDIENGIYILQHVLNNRILHNEKLVIIK